MLLVGVRYPLLQNVAKPQTKLLRIPDNRVIKELLAGPLAATP